MKREDVSGEVKRRYQLTDEQVDNLLALHDLLLTLPPPKFDMAHFVRSELGTSIVPRLIARRGREYWHQAECRTSCCALGLAAINGVGMTDECDGFTTYSALAFGVPSHSLPWGWLFSAAWADFDNTPEGAAARVAWFLTKGVPKDSTEQRAGAKPLCYFEGEGDMRDEDEWPRWVCEYQFEGVAYGLTIPARNEVEARRRVRAIGMTAQVLGQLMEEVPATRVGAGFYVRTKTYLLNRLGMRRT